MFKRILVVFVGSRIKSKSFLVALGMAKKFDSTVTAINCIYKHVPKFYFFETNSDKKSAEQQKKKASKSLENLEKFADEAGVKVKTRLVLTDSITNWVVDYVKGHKTDLLIMDHPHEPQYDTDFYVDIVNAIHNKVKIPVLMLR